MKWLFILLLIANAVCLGWEMDRDVQLDRANVSSAIKVPAGTQRLELLNELERLPETRSPRSNRSCLESVLMAELLPGQSTRATSSSTPWFMKTLTSTTRQSATLWTAADLQLLETALTLTYMTKLLKA